MSTTMAFGVRSNQDLVELTTSSALAVGVTVLSRPSISRLENMSQDMQLLR